MSEMRDSGIEWIGEIPKSWTITILSALFSERKCKNSGLTENNLLSLSYGNIVRKNIESNEGLLPASFETYNIIEPGNIVFRLTDLQNDKRSLRTGLCKERGIITSAYVTLQVRSDDSPRYMHYLFHTYDLCKVFYGMGDGVRQGMNYEDLKRLRILRPDQETQRRIADYLDRKCSQIDAIIARQQEVIEKLKAYKLSVITEAVTKGLSPDVPMKDSGIDFIGSIPETWRICRLRNIGTLQNGISKGGEFFGHGFPFVSYGDVYRNFSLPVQVAGLIDSSDEERRNYSVESGDIFFTRTSETIEEVGFSSVCEETIPDATFAGFLIRVRPFTDDLVPKFAKYYFRSNHHRYYLVKQMNLVTRASLGQDLLKSMPVLVPPKDEQISIAAYLDKKCGAIESSIEYKQRVIERLTSYKKSLIYEVVTGKKEV